jgi:xanthine dehydrogenase YagT iron-sulfur-binding subunit
MHEGQTITTVEGLCREELSPLQQAFVECDAFQCGFCTPGQLCSATAMLGEFNMGEPSSVTQGEVTELTDDEIRERMSGNICRCGAYPNIVKAIKVVIGRD